MQGDLQEKLNCAFAEVGNQMGEILRCMIDQEIAMHINRLAQLNNLLSGDVCEPTPEVLQ